MDKATIKKDAITVRRESDIFRKLTMHTDKVMLRVKVNKLSR